ncbi:NAD(P)/FAD-dependent oxidoreductase, partial [Raoultella terrigena]|uniref:NAD(P)/FAD-dependent oxidoreductase n=1 Tax=Raoultella terrigena TaxID=577 RepID=UPI00132F70B0
LETDGDVLTVSMSDGSRARGRTVVIATGVDYRRLGVPELEALIGRGVYYGAAVAEAPSMTGQEVYVVGGGNSAGQAALHLARYAARVTLLVRGPSLAASMSDYLIGQLEDTENVAIRYRASVRGGWTAEGCLAGLIVGDPHGGEGEDRPAGGLFILIGSMPRTSWLPDELLRDEAGFVRTGPDTLTPEDAARGVPV